MTVHIELPNGIRSAIYIPDRKVKTQAEILEWIKSNTKIIAKRG